jgi:hypothetical protein
VRLFQFHSFLISSTPSPCSRTCPLSVKKNATNDNELNEPQTAVSPSTSPTFTGTLELLRFPETLPIARRLLGLLNGLRFRKLELSWRDEGGLRSVAGLVEACSDTLECLDIEGAGLFCLSAGPAIDSSFGLQVDPHPAAYLTSPKQRSLKTSRFRVARHSAIGLPRHSKPSHLKAETFNKY